MLSFYLSTCFKLFEVWELKEGSISCPKALGTKSIFLANKLENSTRLFTNYKRNKIKINKVLSSYFKLFEVWELKEGSISCPWDKVNISSKQTGQLFKALSRGFREVVAKRSFMYPLANFTA